MDSPPGTSDFSISRTRAPAWEAERAASPPANPKPTTTTSKVSSNRIASVEVQVSRGLVLEDDESADGRRQIDQQPVVTQDVHGSAGFAQGVAGDAQVVAFQDVPAYPGQRRRDDAEAPVQRIAVGENQVAARRVEAPHAPARPGRQPGVTRVALGRLLGVGHAQYHPGKPDRAVGVVEPALLPQEGRRLML